MAGGGGEDNPVAINVTAMVDVIFCLCLFFMCAMHFKQLEGKFESWLPKTGHQPRPAEQPIVLEEIRVFMRWEDGATVRKVGPLPVATDPELMRAVLTHAADHKRLGRTDVPVLIDATAEVPWQDVVRVIDLCKREQMARIEFVEPFRR